MKKLFVLDDQTSPCSRRTLLRGIGAAAAVALVPGSFGCMPSSNVPTATTTTCGSGDVCIDLTANGNTALSTPGGALLIDAFGDTLIVIRTSASQVVALSAVCTHAGCTVSFDSTQNLMVCPCHGSEFSETGAVVRGPAGIPLKNYTATLSNNTITIAG